MQSNRNLTPTSGPQRIIELKLPLPYLLSIMGAVALLIIGMYFKGEKTVEQIQDLKEVIGELKQEVKNGNGLTSTLNSTVQLLQFRLETAESDIRVIKNAPPVSNPSPRR